MIGGTGTYVFSLWHKSVKEEDDWISAGRLFQRMDAATGNERDGTRAAGMIRMRLWAQTMTTRQISNTN